MFGTLGGPELFLILVVALIVFGPRKLPEIGKSMGKMLVEFRRASTEFKRTIETEVETENRRAPTGPSTPATPAALPHGAVPGVGATPQEASGAAPTAAPASDAAPDGSVARETPAAGPETSEPSR